MSRFHIAFVVLAARFLGSRIGAAASTESRCMERAKKKRNKEIRKCKNPEPECVERAKKKFQKKKKKCLRPCLAWNQIGDDIDGDAPSDGFGGAVRLSADGSRMAVGARGGGEAGRGRVIILERNGEDWVQVGDPSTDRMRGTPWAHYLYLRTDLRSPWGPTGIIPSPARCGSLL